MPITRSSTTTAAALVTGALATLGTLGVGVLGAAADGADRVVRSSGPTYVHDPAYAGVEADVHAVTAANGTTAVTLHLSGLPASARGSTLGAHVHTARCGSSAGASGPHHADPGAAPGTPLPQREIWLDAAVNQAGHARSFAVATWVIQPGAAASVVVHAKPTNPSDGSAGPRLFCTDVAFGGPA